MINSVFVRSNVGSFLTASIENKSYKIDLKKVNVVDKLSGELREGTRMPEGEYMVYCKHPRLPTNKHLCNLKIERNKNGDMIGTILASRNLNAVPAPVEEKVEEKKPEPIKEEAVPEEKEAEPEEAEEDPDGEEKTENCPVPTMEYLSSKTYRELQEYARNLNLKASGKKESIAARIIDYYSK